MSDWLVLFDIDGTLLDTRGAGLKAIRSAVADLYGAQASVPRLELGGATDAGLVREILTACGTEPDDGKIADFYKTYVAHLAELLRAGDFTGEILPGVRELLDAFRQSGAILGLLTGNLEEGAMLKLERFELEEYFTFGSYGHERIERTELGPIALARAQKVHGRSFHALETVIIGDTPRDVACGRALGAWTIAVATGSSSVEELSACEPSLLLDTLEGPGQILSEMDNWSRKVIGGEDESGHPC